jgi:hypothetical protein
MAPRRGAQRGNIRRMTDPDDARKQYADRLGGEFGDYFFYLNQSVFGLVGIWDVYRSFFGTNEQRVDLLNRASGYVTRIIQDSLHERVILGICQVTDRKISMGRKNLTVHGLPDFIVDAGFRDEVTSMIESATAATSFARDLRDKLIAHSDLAATMGSYQVEHSSRERIVLAIRSIIKPLRHIHTRYFDATQLYHTIRPLPDEVGFLRCIYLGVEQEEEERRSWARTGRPGRPSPEWLNEGERNEFDSEFYLPPAGEATSSHSS